MFVAVDAIHRIIILSTSNIGFEYSAMDMFFLRIGKSHTFYDLKLRVRTARVWSKVYHLEEVSDIVFHESMIEVNYVLTSFGVLVIFRIFI